MLGVSRRYMIAQLVGRQLHADGDPIDMCVCVTCRISDISSEGCSAGESDSESDLEDDVAIPVQLPAFIDIVMPSRWEGAIVKRLEKLLERLVVSPSKC